MTTTVEMCLEGPEVADKTEGAIVRLNHLPRVGELIELWPAPSGKTHRYTVKQVMHRQGRCPIVVVS